MVDYSNPFTSIQPAKKSSKLEMRGQTRYSSIIMIILGSMLAFEVFSGALRFYLDQFGLVSLIYLPKILCLVAVLIEIFNIKNFKTTGWTVGFLLLSCFIGIYNGASLTNIAFSFFNFSPLLFAIFYGRYIEIRSKDMQSLISYALLISIVGVLFDKFFTLPWEGFNYSIGDLAIEGNRQWTTIGIDRVAGFSRVSSSLAIMLAVFSIYFNSFPKATIIKILVTLLVTYCIFLTTSKSVLVAYIIGLIASVTISWKPIKLLFFVVPMVGILLPFTIILLKYQGFAELITDDLGVFVLASFDARLTYTWPSFYELVEKNNGFFWGTGFGTVGSSVSTFPIAGISGTIRQSLAVADNTALYLWGMLGFAGVFFYAMSYRIMAKLKDIRTNNSFVLAEINLCICISSWAVDVLETVVGCLFVGFAISFAYGINQKSNRLKY